MGFEQHAIRVIKENQRLRRSRKDKHFQLVESRLKRPDNYTLDKQFDFSEIEKKKSLDILRTWVFTLLFSMIGGFILFSFLGKKIVTINQVNQEEKRQIRVQKLILEPVYAYNLLISSGNVKFKAGDTKEAHYEFLRALKLKPKGERAIFGLTKCLIVECKEQKHNCESARTYYNSLLKSRLIDKDEIRQLEKLYDIR